VGLKDSFTSCGYFLPPRRRNQTKVGLKATLFISISPPPSQKKSDQGGIERLAAAALLALPLLEEIRPRWD